MKHPEALPMDRTCRDCGRTLPLNVANFSRRSGPGRYPWQPSAWSPRCKACQALKLKALRAAIPKAQKHAKETKRQRDEREAVRGSLMTRDAYRATKAAAKVKAAANLARAALIAEDRRIARGGRRYSEATDPVKQMIRADVAARAAKRAGRSAALAMVAPEPEPMDAEQQDHLKLLEALRDKHRREAGET